jgi:hypothetical protein
MAVGRPQHLPAPLPSPALSQQLLARIEPEATRPLRSGVPDIETRPDQLDLPDGGTRISRGPRQRGRGGGIGDSQQQGASLLGLGDLKHLL